MTVKKYKISGLYMVCISFRNCDMTRFFSVNDIAVNKSPVDFGQVFSLISCAKHDNDKSLTLGRNNALFLCLLSYSS